MPRRWKKGIIIPILKKGDKHKVENYRGITLLDTPFKIYAMIIEEKLNEEVEAKNIIPENQAGFRKGKSTSDNIYILNHVIEEELKKERGKIFAFFVDIKAAFNNVNRQDLILFMKQAELDEAIVHQRRKCIQRNHSGDKNRSQYNRRIYN